MGFGGFAGGGGGAVGSDGAGGEVWTIVSGSNCETMVCTVPAMGCGLRGRDTPCGLSSSSALVTDVREGGFPEAVDERLASAERLASVAAAAAACATAVSR